MDRRFFIAGGVALVALGGAALLTQGSGTGSDLLVGMANAQTADADPSAIADMVLGSDDAPVKITEYASYTCPHCANFHTTLFPQIKEMIDAGQVQFTYREVYFDRFGLWASMVARCGGQERFFAISDLIYEKQREWTGSGDPATMVDELRKYGKMAGLDDAALDVCLQDADMAQNLVAWFEQNAAADSVTSTPTFFINGERLQGNWATDLIPAIEAAL